jgi:uncharacterized damage-inducible protein DinB
VRWLCLFLTLTHFNRQAIIRAMRKADVLNDLREARADLLDAISGLTPEQMMRPGVIGFWSIKDLLDHLVAWESEVVTALNQVQNKKKPSILQIEEIDEWNEDNYHKNARRLLDAVLKDFEGVHRMLTHMIEDYPERDLMDNRRYPWMEGEPLAYLIEESAMLHERDHAADIRAWREREGI